MERIASFTVNHDVLVPGLYLSRRDGDVTTFDLRFKKPNTGDLLTNAQMHSVEHIIATLLRNSPEKDAVIYFGPMGCQTGFYFLFDSRRLTDTLQHRKTTDASMEMTSVPKNYYQCSMLVVYSCHAQKSTP